MRREPLTRTFGNGLLEYIPDLTDVMNADREGGKPERPFLNFRLYFNGNPPWERSVKTLQKTTVVDSSDPNWDKDIEKDYSRDAMITVECEIVSHVSGKAWHLVQRVKSYWENQFNDDARDNPDLDKAYCRQAMNNSFEFGPAQGTAFPESKYLIEAEVITLLKHVETIRTIETLEFTANSDVHSGGSISL